MKADVSIIIPAFNEELNIRQCIKAVRNQSHDCFECIVVDDGSIDQTVAVANDEIGFDSRFRIICKEHGGLSSARNAGLDVASGRFVAYVDADDIPLPEFLSRPLEFVESNSLDIAFFEADLENCGLDERRFLRERNYFNRIGMHGIRSGKDMLKTLVEEDDFIAPVYLQLARKEAVRHRFCNGILYEDELYTVQNMLMAERVGHLKEKLYLRRCRPGSIINSKRKSLNAVSKWISAQEMLKMLNGMRNDLSDAETMAVERLVERSLAFAFKVWKQIPESERKFPEWMNEDDARKCQLALNV